MLLLILGCTAYEPPWGRLLGSWGAAVDDGELVVSYQRNDVLDEAGPGGEPTGEGGYYTSWEVVRVGDTVERTTLVPVAAVSPYDLGFLLSAPIAGDWLAITDTSQDRRAFQRYRDLALEGPTIDTCEMVMSGERLAHRRFDGSVALAPIADPTDEAVLPELAVPAAESACTEHHTPLLLGGDAVVGVNDAGIVVWRPSGASSVPGEAWPEAVWTSGDEVRLVTSELDGAVGRVEIAVLRAAGAVAVPGMWGCTAAAFDAAGTAYVLTLNDGDASLHVVGDTVETIALDTPWREAAACELFVEGDTVRAVWIEWSVDRSHAFSHIALRQALVRDGAVELAEVVDLAPDLLVER